MVRMNNGLPHLEERLQRERFEKHCSKTPDIVRRRGREVFISGNSRVADVLEKNGAAVSEEHLRWCVGTAVMLFCTNRLANFVDAV